MGSVVEGGIVRSKPGTKTTRRPWTDQPDSRDGAVYVLSENLGLAVDVAFAIGRPLLLRGEPGTGKSSLAAYLARTRGLRYYEHVVTAQTQASDLLWSFDTVRRLGDAQTRNPGESLDDFNYVEPGPLWWALAPRSAARRGKPPGEPVARPAAEPFARMNQAQVGRGAVVLIDEIDKADPDMPNGLLVPLGTGEFVVTETGTVVTQESPGAEHRPDYLVVITTNEERELPQAFLRRCVVAVLPTPDKTMLVEIAEQHLERRVGPGQADRKLIEALAAELGAARADARKMGIRPPGTAEFLDALRACWNLGIGLDSKEWRDLRQMVLLKPQREPAGDEQRYLAR
jgi:MoxR-like ATPase